MDAPAAARPAAHGAFAERRGSGCGRWHRARRAGAPAARAPPAAGRRQRRCAAGRPPPPRATRAGAGRARAGRGDGARRSPRTPTRRRPRPARRAAGPRRSERSAFRGVRTAILSCGLRARRGPKQACFQHRRPAPVYRGSIDQGGRDMRARMALLVMAVCAAVAAAPATAGAQEPAGLTKVVPVTGKSKSGKQFRGTYAIDRFRTRVASWSPSARFAAGWASRRVAKRGVTMPAALSSGRRAAAQLPPDPERLRDPRPGARADQPRPARARRSDQSHQREDRRGAGARQPAGNLLCAITGLLDPQATVGAPAGPRAERDPRARSQDGLEPPRGAGASPGAPLRGPAGGASGTHE